MKAVMGALDAHIQLSGKRVMIQYILLSGVNDTDEMADHLTLYASKPTYTTLVKQLIKYNLEGKYDI